MRKLSSFFYRFSSVIMMIIGVFAAILWALKTGFELTEMKAWGEPGRNAATIEAVVGFSIAVSGLGLIIIFGFLSMFAKGLKFFANFGKFIIMTIAFLLILGSVISSGIWLGNNSWTKFETVEAKITISTFSIGTILLIMNVVFGILAGILKSVQKSKAKNAQRADA